MPGRYPTLVRVVGLFRISRDEAPMLRMWDHHHGVAQFGHTAPAALDDQRTYSVAAIIRSREGRAAGFGLFHGCGR
jgi:hypothetical protein